MNKEWERVSQDDGVDTRGDIGPLEKRGDQESCTSPKSAGCLIDVLGTFCDVVTSSTCHRTVKVARRERTAEGMCDKDEIVLLSSFVEVVIED